MPQGKPGRKPKPRVFGGERLRRRRQERGLSQAAFAALVGDHEIDVSRYERGAVDPSLHTRVAPARVRSGRGTRLALRPRL